MLLVPKLGLELFDLLVRQRDLVGEVLSAGPECLEISWIKNVAAQLLVRLFCLKNLIRLSSLILGWYFACLA
jgi:hypothetical protein